MEILISCAGDAEVGLLHELDSAEFARQVQVNLVGAHRMVAAVVPGMVARQRGDVVFVSSDVVRTPRPRMGAYVAAKHGVDGMARRPCRWSSKAPGSGSRSCDRGRR